MGHLKSYNWTMVHSAVEEKVAARLPLIAATKTHRAQSGRLPTKKFVAIKTCSVGFFIAPVTRKLSSGSRPQVMRLMEQRR